MRSLGLLLSVGLLLCACDPASDSDSDEHGLGDQGSSGQNPGEQNPGEPGNEDTGIPDNPSLCPESEFQGLPPQISATHTIAGKSGPTLLAASPEGLFYGVGTHRVSDANTDVRSWGLSSVDGSPLWTTNWGDTKGWSEFPTAITADRHGVIVAGPAGIYESQEYWYRDGPFAMAYNSRGQLRWRFRLFDEKYVFAEDDIVVAGTQDGGAVLALTHTQRQGDRELELFVVDGQGILQRVISHVDPEGARLGPRALQVSEGTIIMAGERWGGRWIARWSLDGALQSNWYEERGLVDHRLRAKIAANGQVAFGGSFDQHGGQELSFVSRHQPTGEKAFELILPTTTEGGHQVRDLDIACDGSVTVLLSDRFSPGGELIALDAAGVERWRSPRLELQLLAMTRAPLGKHAVAGWKSTQDDGQGEYQVLILNP